MARESGKNERGKGAKPQFPTRKIITTPIRLSYPYLFDARQNDNGTDYWETEALIPPTKEGDALRAKLMDAMTEVMEDHFGPEDEWPRGRNDYLPEHKLKYVDPKKIPGPGIDEDWTIFRARSYQPVGVVDANKDEVLNKREVYGGRWARLSITVSVYDDKSKGVTIYLNNVQLLDNDESFGGRPSADSDFDQWDGDELASGASRDRDDRGGRGRDREDSRSGRDGGRGDGGRSRDDGRRGDSSRARSDRDEGRSDEHDTRPARGARGVDERDTDRDVRTSDRDRDNRVSDRDRGGNRDRSDREASRDGGRARSRDDDDRGRGREDDRRGRGDDRDTDTRSDRGRSSRDDEDDDRRPSRGRSGRDDRDDDWS